MTATVARRWAVDEQLASDCGVEVEELAVAGETWGLLFHRTAPVALSRPTPTRRPKARLSRRQANVLSLLGEGMNNSKIGEALGLSEDTVKVHLRGIYRKLGADSRSHAVALAFQCGILT